MGHIKKLHKVTLPREDGLPTVIIDFLLLLFMTAYSVIASILAWLLPSRYRNITNDIILITGASRGIGRLLAVELTQYQPKKIILWGRNRDTLETTCKAVSAHGVLCSFMICDVTDRDQVYQKAQEIRETIGHVTILVNNAGVVCGKKITDADPNEIQQVLETNLLSHHWVLKAFLPGMLKCNRGHIVNMNSVLGLMGFAGAIAYSASKHGALGLTESLLLEIRHSGHTGINFTNIHPFQVDTPMFAGCRTRFDFLFPPLEVEYVVWKTIDAILRKKQQVLIPRIMYILYIFKNLVPVQVMLHVARFMGTDSAMNTFYRRRPVSRYNR